MGLNTCCPKCEKPVIIDISKSLDEEGEVFMCPNCKFKFRYIKI
ncbi:MAG: hypothetical protein VZS44_07680 [Bacilli bacterium]|nr:hypothetical protein [Bacilli bacterium]